MASEAEQGGSSSTGTGFFDFTGKLSPCPLEGNGGGGPDGCGGEFHVNQVKKPGFPIDLYGIGLRVCYYMNSTLASSLALASSLVLYHRRQNKYYYGARSRIDYYSDSTFMALASASASVLASASSLALVLALALALALTLALDLSSNLASASALVSVLALASVLYHRRHQNKDYYGTLLRIDYYSDSTFVETEDLASAMASASVRYHRRQNKDYFVTWSRIDCYSDSTFMETLAWALGSALTSALASASVLYHRRQNKILEEQLPGPRPSCTFSNTKFCYYNNYGLSQPRHFCKTCRGYWTHGGTLRNTAVGGGARKNATRSCIVTANAGAGQDYPLHDTFLFVPFQGNSAQFWAHGGRALATNEVSESCSEYQKLKTFGAKPQEDIADGRFHHKITNPSSPRNGHKSEDDGGQFHTIQVDETDPYSARSISNDTQASRALINTSFPSDQSDDPPPPDRSPSVIEFAAEIVQEEQEFNLFGLAKTFLSISAGEGFASLAVRYGTGNPLPENARILLSLGELCTVAAFLLCSSGYIMERSRRAKLAARLMTVGGVVAASSAFVLMMGSLLTNF